MNTGMRFFITGKKKKSSLNTHAAFPNDSEGLL